MTLFFFHRHSGSFVCFILLFFSILKFNDDVPSCTSFFIHCADDQWALQTRDSCPLGLENYYFLDDFSMFSLFTFSRISVCWMLSILDSSSQCLSVSLSLSYDDVVYPFIFLFYSLKDYLEFVTFSSINVLSCVILFFILGFSVCLWGAISYVSLRIVNSVFF